MKPVNRTAQITETQQSETVNRYRLRAELRQDIAQLIEKLGPRCLRSAVELACCKLPDGTKFCPGDADALIDVVGLSLDELRDVIREIPDGHVMLQTVQTPKNYTGERDRSLV